MIPSIITEQVKNGIEFFIRTTFPPEGAFRGLFDQFFNGPKSIFKGPYLNLRLPFRPTEDDYQPPFPEINVKFKAYRHQQIAFDRLAGDSPQSTLVATGTGSGKTECFMYPLLDYCWRHRNEKGVKAIIIYPMNALATDQARRLAKEIYNNPALKGNVTAGLFIGGAADYDGCDAMTADSVITRKDTIREYPPSILLTNYKMLDYLLIRPKDFKLWRYNNPETLKFVVVDELHTFDGAQGTDLASLLRRLYARLRKEPGQVCCVGTSATLGDSEQDRKKLLKFARKLFGTDFAPDSIVTEDILEPHEFFAKTLVQMWPHPDESKQDRLLLKADQSENDYLTEQSRLWFDGEFVLPPDPSMEDRVELGDMLKQHIFFRNLIELLNNTTIDWQELSQRFDQIISNFSQKPKEYRIGLIDSIFALISFARRKITDNNGSSHFLPFLNVRCTLWLREMTRMVASVENTPKLQFHKDLKSDDEGAAYLPIAHCRSCGQIAYLSVKSRSEHRFSRNLQEIYKAFFTKSPNLHYIFHDDRSPASDSSPKKEKQQEFRQFLCGHCLTLTEGENSVPDCPRCHSSAAMLPVRVENPQRNSNSSNGDMNRVRVDNDCPLCDERNSLTIVGSRVASLISVAISQLFASNFNDDRKILAFSDSVQDAAHRASFFEARTFRFNLRGAIQKIVDSEDAPIPLADLPDRFIQFWKEDKEFGSDKNFITQFIPSDLKNDDFELLKRTNQLPANSGLLKDLNNRLNWEILSEYGFLSRIGRTLEKSGCSIATLRPDLRDEWSRRVHQKLTQEIGELRNVDPKEITRLLLGFVWRMRTRGGICAGYLDGYMNDGNSYNLKFRKPFLPKFSQRAPIFLQKTRGISRFDSISRSSGTRSNFYSKLLPRILGEKVAPYHQEIFRVILEEGENLQILESNHKNASSDGSRNKSDNVVWGLNPKVLQIEKNVDQLVCDETDQKISAPESEREFWIGMPSFRFDHDGHYRLLNVNNKGDYYQELYRNGRVHRVVAKEHTGLLERKDREELENEFIQGGLGAVNTLSCTPTLEMGINIGDLSTGILCSMPPSQTNYVQRIGRAGRRDGNSFNLVVATGRPHDIHFFTEPEKMFSGEITPPGIFLEAPKVLERQLIGYCFDRWIQDIKGRDIIPPKLKTVLDNIGNATPDESAFPYPLLFFIKDNRESLFNGFCDIFQNDLPEETINSLRESFFNDNDGIEWRILDQLRQKVLERKRLNSSLKSIRYKIKNLENKPQDDVTQREIKDLQIEKSAIHNSIKHEFDEKDTFNFFTDEGLLPNYAFPESGVTLKSIIYSNKQSDNERKTVTTEYERPAKAAIRDFAPGNYFYINGRKLKINRIVISNSETAFGVDDSRNSNAYDTWHFCGNCNYIEKNVATSQHSASCPKCGSSTWSDINMTRKVLRLRQVISNQSDSDNRLLDDSDEREPRFFNSQMLVEFPQQSQKCYKFDNKEFPFAFEYRSKVNFREVNFGESRADEGDDLTIAGKKVPRHGFRICSDCGMVQFDDNKPNHHVSCKHYNKEKKQEKGLIECVYLYREFTSEAIRILLPIDSLNYEVKLHSFVASLYMGLKEEFEGNVDHLQITLQDEPIPGSPLRKRYLIIYDQVPGGTGYLKELISSPTKLKDLFQKAYDKLLTCPCHEEQDKDGCYRCLFAYRLSRDIDQISRKRAIELLSQILQYYPSIVETDSIDNISPNPLLESELEVRFIKAFEFCSSDNVKFEIGKDICHGKCGYLLKVRPNNEKELLYQIIPQFELGKSNNIQEESRVDFLIIPPPNSDLKKIAVFTDGFVFHANPENENYRLGKDIKQRIAIIRSGEYLCWSLSFEDVQTKFEGISPHNHWEPISNLKADKYLPQDFSGVLQMDSFDMLLHLLSHPKEESWSQTAFYGILSFDENYRRITDDAIANQIKESVRKDPDIENVKTALTNVLDDKSETYYLLNKTIKQNYESRLLILGVVDKNDIKPKNYKGLSVTIRLDDKGDDINIDDFKYDWNSMLNALNLFQFIPDVSVLTTRLIQEGYEPPLQKEDSSSNMEIYEITDPLVHPLIRIIQSEGLPEPCVGFELENSSGEVCGMAELAWEKEKLGVLLTNEFQDEFRLQGWDVFVVSEESQWMEQVKKLLNERVNK